MNTITNITPFDWSVVIYLTLAGIACGTTVVALLFMSSPTKSLQSLIKPALWLAAISISLGTAGLVLHLGAPEDFYLLFTEFNPASVVAWGVRIIIIFTMLCLLAALVYDRDSSSSVGWLFRSILMVFAIIIGIYPALVLGQATARALWDVAILIPLFLLVGLHSGFACIQLFTDNDWQQNNQAWINKLDFAFILFSAALILFLIFTTPISELGKENLLYGDYAVWLWLGVVLVGWVIPLLSNLINNNKTIIVFRQLCFISGAFALRAFIVFGGQTSATFIGA